MSDFSAIEDKLKHWVLTEIARAIVTAANGPGGVDCPSPDHQVLMEIRANTQDLQTKVGALMATINDISTALAQTQDLVVRVAQRLTELTNAIQNNSGNQPAIDAAVSQIAALNNAIGAALDANPVPGAIPPSQPTV